MLACSVVGSNVGNVTTLVERRARSLAQFVAKYDKCRDLGFDLREGGWSVITVLAIVANNPSFANDTIVARARQIAPASKSGTVSVRVSNLQPGVRCGIRHGE